MLTERFDKLGIPVYSGNFS